MNEEEVYTGSHCYESEPSISASSNVPRKPSPNPEGTEDYLKSLKTKSRIMQQYILIIGILIIYAFCIVYIVVFQIPVIYVISFGVTGMFGIAGIFKQMAWKILFNENVENPKVE